MHDKQKISIKKGKGGWIFLLIVLFIYGVVALLDGGLAVKAIDSFTRLLDQIVPVLFIVFILIFIINLWLEPAWVKKYLGHRSGLTGYLVALMGGILSTGPVYPWYALLKDLRKKGMKTSLAVVFLYSRAIKLPWLPMLVHYFGITYTLVLLGYLLLFSIFSGIIVEQFDSGQRKRGQG